MCQKHAGQRRLKCEGIKSQEISGGSKWERGGGGGGGYTLLYF